MQYPEEDERAIYNGVYHQNGKRVVAWLPPETAVKAELSLDRERWMLRSIGDDGLRQVVDEGPPIRSVYEMPPTIYRLKEPTGEPAPITDVETISFEFPDITIDGTKQDRYDCAGMLVDSESGDVFLITRRTRFPNLFKISGEKIDRYLESPSDKLVAEHLGKIPGWSFGSRILGADTDRDGKILLIKDKSRLFSVERGTSSFQKMVLGGAGGLQREHSYVGTKNPRKVSNEIWGQALALDFDGETYFTLARGSGDKRSGPLRHYPRRSKVGLSHIYQKGGYAVCLHGVGAFVQVGVELDGEGVEVADVSGILGDPHTVAVWYQPLAEPEKERVHPIWINAGENEEAPRFEGLFFITNSTGLRGRFVFAKWTGPGPPRFDQEGVAIIASPKNMPTGIRYRIALVRTEDETILHVGSTSSGTDDPEPELNISLFVSDSLGPESDREVWTIGGWSSPSDTPLPSALGVVDHLRVYDIALPLEALEVITQRTSDKDVNSNAIPDDWETFSRIREHIGKRKPLTLDRAEAAFDVLRLNLSSQYLR